MQMNSAFLGVSQLPINKKESTFIVDLNEINSNWKKVRGRKRQETIDKIGEFLLEKINQKLDQSNSPVKGGKFKKKKADGSSSQLFEEGDLRINIDYRPHRRGVKVGVFDDSEEVERLKSFNHNTGDTLPKREFIPNASDSEAGFKGDINRGVSKLINEAVEEGNG